MAFTVEDGSIVAGANSYTDRTFADAYHDDRGNTDWGCVNDKDQESALVRATDYIDRNFRFIGCEVDAETQELRWPRERAIKEDRTLLADDAIPVEVQRATAELALSAVTGDLDPDGRDVASQSSRRAGSVSVSQTLVGNRPTFHKAQTILFDVIVTLGLKRA